MQSPHRMGTRRTHTISELCREGDHVCEVGDHIALADIAWDLVARTHEPLHCELVPLADRCADPERATAAWCELKDKLQRADLGS